jgi:hypothetical protein
VARLAADRPELEAADPDRRARRDRADGGGAEWINRRVAAFARELELDLDNLDTEGTAS